MSVEKITLNVGKIHTLKDSYKKAAIVIAILSLIIAIMSESSFLSAFLSAFFIMFLVTFFGVSLYNLFCIRYGVGFIKKNQQKVESALKEKGFHVNFAGNGILIDNQNKKVAFVSSTNSDVLLCDLSDIRSWKQESFQETTQYVNHENAYAGSKTRTHFIHIIVHLSSPEYPEARFNVADDREASLWIGRLNALVNG